MCILLPFDLLSISCSYLVPGSFSRTLKTSRGAAALRMMPESRQRAARNIEPFSPGHSWLVVLQVSWFPIGSLFEQGTIRRHNTECQNACMLSNSSVMLVIHLMISRFSSVQNGYGNLPGCVNKYRKLRAWKILFHRSIPLTTLMCNTGPPWCLMHNTGAPCTMHHQEHHRPCL